MFDHRGDVREVTLTCDSTDFCLSGLDTIYYINLELKKWLNDCFNWQANTTDELPERLIGAVRVSHIELSSAIVPKLDLDPSWQPKDRDDWPVLNFSKSFVQI